MRRSERAVGGILAVLLAAALVYLGVYAARLLSDPVRRARAELYTCRETVEISGIIVREERLLERPQPFFALRAAGRRVAAGETLGVAGGSEEAVTAALGLLELEEERRWIEAALPEDTSELSAERAGEVRSALSSFSAALARGDMPGLENGRARLRTLLWEREDEGLLRRLEALERRRAALAEAAAGTERLTAPESGLFSPWTDGYEAVTPQAPALLSAPALKALLDGPADAAAQSCGKLVTGSCWYLAALLPGESAAALTPGEEAVLDLSALAGAEPALEVLSVGEETAGERAVVFVCRRFQEETLALRRVDAPLILRSVTGLRIPAAALREDEAGQSYVLLADGPVAERADVTVLRRSGDYALVESGTLREGAVVLTGGKNLYDGKVL